MLFNIGAVTAMLYITETTEQLNSIIKLHQVEQLRRSLLINLQIVQSQLYTMNTPFSQDLDAIVESTLMLEKAASRCSECHHPPQLNNRLIHLKSLLKDYENHLSLYITIRANEERMRNLELESAQIGNEIIAQTQTMSHSASETLENLSTESANKIAHVKKILIITIAMTLFFGIIVALNLIKSITSPVKKLLNATRLIESGKLGTTISYNDTTEFSELAENFNNMSTGLKNGYESLQNEIVERKQTEEALRDSEEKLQSVFNHMQDIFYRTDEQGRIVWVTPSAAKLLRYGSTNTITGLDFKELYPDSEKRQLFLEELSQEGKVTNYEIEMLRSDGSTIIVSASSHFYHNKNGEFAGVECSCRDITETKKREEEHQKIQKLESTGIIAGGIAHDFNNILTTITTSIALAKISADNKTDIYNILTSAEKACLNAKNLTSQLLTFSQGGAPIKKIKNIQKLLKDSASFALSGSAVKCAFFIQDDLYTVKVDTGQLMQVVNNLVINAIQAMPNGGTIEISAENILVEQKERSPLNVKECIKISIKDQGTGIPKEHINKIFDPYFTTKQQGSGLGLSSTYSIIKNHQGHIDVESELSVGTTFNLYLPAAKGELSHEDFPSDKILKGTGKILIMDDEEKIRENLSTLLEKCGYQVEKAKEGAEAITLYKKAKASFKSFDAIIMDLTISGGMGGKDAMKHILEFDPEVKAIVSSGYCNDSIMANFKQYGFRGVITKPFKIEELSELLLTVIRE
jgi:PAS domain S-box-containing protein